jgi:2'-5' RNA ligase
MGQTTPCFIRQGDALADTEHIRFFIALPLAAPSPAARLIEALHGYAPPLKPVDPAALHLTVRFLGPAATQRVEAFASALDAAVEQTRPGPIELAWAGPRFFPGPPPKRARTIVLPPANLDADNAIYRLEAALSERLQQLDPPIEPEARGFHPHLTLARIKQPRGKRRSPPPWDAIDSMLNRYADTSFERSTLDRLVLYRSTLTPGGPHYEVVREARL